MPRRVIDADAAWGSSKLANCKEEFIPEYTWLYGLADAYGNFELSDLRVIHGKVAAIRPHFTVDTLKAILDDFHKNGLLFIWEQAGKKYGHWTGSDKPGRLPPKSQRNHYQKLNFTTPDEAVWPELQNYLAEIALPAFAHPELFTEKKTFPSAEDIREEAETRADQAASNGHQGDPVYLKFLIFWNLYPVKHDRPGAWRKFRRLQPTDMDTVIASIEAWEASSRWQDPQYIPDAVNFIKKEDWKNPPPPKEKNNVRRIGNQVDPDEITRRNLENAGFVPPRTARNTR